MSVEVPQHSPEASVEAEKIFQDYSHMFTEFNDRVDRGDIVLEPATEGFDVNTGTVWLNADGRTYIDPALKARVYEWRNTQETKPQVLSKEEIISSSMPDDLKTVLGEALDKQELASVFDVSFAQKPGGTWWLNQPGMPEGDLWLKGAELKGFTEVSIGENRIAVSFFTDEVEPEVVGQGIAEVVSKLAEMGVDLSHKFKWINIVDESVYADFEVPSHILEKFPSAYVAAVARNARGEIKLNAKMFKSSFNKKNDQGQILSLAGSWQETLMHEIGHIYNHGLADTSDATPATDIGWRRRDAIIVDDYGNLIELRDSSDWSSSSSYTTDNYGKDVYIGAVKAAQQLLFGTNDAEGNTVQPPSRYAAESSEEDIAESFTAYFYGKPLDAVRRAVIEKILSSQRTLEAGHMPNISFRQVDPMEVDIWSYMPKHIKFLPTSVYL